MTFFIRLFVCISFIFYSSLTFCNSTARGFIENKGQLFDQDLKPNPNVLYTYNSKGIKIQLRQNGYSYELFSADHYQQNPFQKKSSHFSSPESISLKVQRIDIDFYGCSSDPRIIHDEEVPGHVNYFVNGIEAADIHSFQKVIYKNIYPFTDIEFIVTGNTATPLKYNIILRPGSDINKIKFLCRGASRIEMAGKNNLLLSTPIGSITEKIPLSYYADSPKQNRIVDFNLNDSLVSFSANYDHSKTLVIDPTSNLIWGTYIGGTSLDFCTCTGTDASNNVYVAGYSLSTSNIATTGSYQTTLNGSYDLYLEKFDSNGNIIWGTYFGGANLETARALYVESNGTIYVCGDSSSPANIASAGAHQTIYGGGIDDAILVKFDTNGQRLWSTYYGGTQHDIAYAITVDGNGNPVIAGHTESSNTSSCIATAGAHATNFNFASDIFIAKFNSSGVRQWGTYYGDSGFEEAWGVDCDANNNIVITGFSESLSGLTTTGCHQAFNAGGQDAFISKFNPTGTTLLWGTFFGGLGNEQGSAIEIDNNGIIFVGGNTTSSVGISTPGTYQTNIGSSDDAFLTAFTSSGTQLWGTYFGGEDTEYISDMLLDNNMNILFCGETLSTFSISTPGAYQPSITTVNSYDAYFAKFSNSGAIKLSTYYGGEADDNAKGIALDNTGRVYLAGETTSTAGISTPGSFMPVYGSTGDGFLAKFCISSEPLISPAGTATICQNSSYTLNAPAGFPFYFWNTGFTSNPLILTPPLTPGNYYYTVVVTDAYGCNGMSDSTKIVVDNCTVGLTGQKPGPEFQIFPVPAEDLLQLTGNIHGENFLASIFSSLGQKVLTFTIKNESAIIDVSLLVPGVYTLKLSNGSSVHLKKFIKE